MNPESGVLKEISGKLSANQQYFEGSTSYLARFRTTRTCARSRGMSLSNELFSVRVRVFAPVRGAIWRARREKTRSGGRARV